MLTWIRGFFSAARPDDPQRPGPSPTTDRSPNVARALDCQPVAPTLNSESGRTATRSAAASRTETQPQLPAVHDPDQQATVFSFRMRVPNPAASSEVVSRPRERTLADAQLGTARQRRQLARLGIVTLADLRRCSPRRMVAAGQLPLTAGKHLRRWQRMLHMCAVCEGMTMIDAQLLFLVYRRSLADLRRATPARLTADLERFAWSSQGRSILGKRECPTKDQVSQWIAAAAKAISASPSE